MTTQKVSGELMISDSPSAPTALQPPTSPSKRCALLPQLQAKEKRRHNLSVCSPLHAFGQHSATLANSELTFVRANSLLLTGLISLSSRGVSPKPPCSPLIKDQLELVRRADSASGSCKFEARTSKNSPRIKKPSALLWLLLSATQVISGRGNHKMNAL